MASSMWSDWFPMSRALNLKPSRSDHLPILMEVRESRPKKKKKKKRFRFEDCWILNEECREVVERGWECDAGGDPFSIINRKIANTRVALLNWSKSCFGNIKEEIELTRAQLAMYFDSSVSAPSSTERVALQAKLNSLIQQEHTFWKQRAKVFWLSDGDLNTKFFHHSANSRRKKNLLKGLFSDEGMWCSADEDLETIVLKY